METHGDPGIGGVVFDAGHQEREGFGLFPRAERVPHRVEIAERGRDLLIVKSTGLRRDLAA